MKSDNDLISASLSDWCGWGDGGGANEIEIEYIYSFAAIPIDTNHNSVGRAPRGRRFNVQ